MADERKRIDPRKIEDLYQAFENADFIVRKRYREDLDKYPICDLPDWIGNVIFAAETSDQDESNNRRYELGENVQFIKIEKLVYDENENTLDKLTTVYHTMASFTNTSIIMVLHSNGMVVDIYLGVAERISPNGIIDINGRGNKLATLKTAFEANFPGSTVVEMVDEMPIDKQAVINDFCHNVNAVSSVTNIASFRNRDVSENKKFVQGLEKLIDAMRGKEFSALFIADCKGVAEIEELCASYEDIYSKLSPFSQSQQTIGKTSGVTDTESFIEGVTDTTNESVADTLSHSHTIGKSSSDTVGGSVTAGGKAGVPFVAEGSVSVSANYSHTSGRNESATDTEAKTKTTGTAKSLTKQNSVAKSITTSTNDGLQISFQNRAVKTLMDRIDENIKHLRSCEAFGVFDFSCYFLAEESSISMAAASVYDSLMRGEESGTEVSSVNTWTDTDVVKALEYLKRFYHPLVAVPNLSKPKRDDKGIITGLYEILPVTPSTIVSGKEIAIHMGLPKKSVPGIPVTECAEFGRNVLSLDNKSIGGLKLGSVYHMQKIENQEVNLDVDSLSMHTFITGSTGSGKSNTVYQLLNQLKENDVHFLVIEPAKGEYKNVFGSRSDVSVYGTNPKLTTLLRINPFSFPEGVHIYEHMDRLVEIFNVCWPMYAAMPAVLKDAIERAYIDAGWNLRTSVNRYDNRLFPTFSDVLNQIDEVMNESQYSADSKGDYKGALSTRLKSLTNGINGMIFCADEIPAAEFFDKNVIVDLSRVGSTETKSLIMGLLVMKLQEYRMTSSLMNEKLKHITVLEEAHNLLKRTSTEQSSEGANLLGKSVEMLTNAIAEMRTYGEGFIIADQAPGLLDMAVIRNTNTKIILRLPEFSDRELVGRACALNESQIEELARLEKGVAAVYQNDWIDAVLCKVDHFKDNNEELYHRTPYKDSTAVVKNTLIDAIIHNKLHEKIEWLDKHIISANLSARLKCGIIEYKSSHPRDFATLSKIAYELFEAEKIFTKFSSDTAKFSEYLRNTLDSSIHSLHDSEMQLLTMMLVQEHIRRYPEQKTLLEPLCRRGVRG